MTIQWTFGLVLCISIPLNAFALKQKSQVQGFAEIPFITTSAWENVIDLDLYTDPADGKAPKKVITDISTLRITSMGFEGETFANVYSVQPNWYQVRTIDNQLFWIKQNATKSYISFNEHLINNAITGHASVLTLLSEPNDNARPFEQPSLFLEIGRYAVLETRTVSGVLWMRVKHSWAGFEHRVENMSKDDIQFNYQGWVKAYDADGEPAFEFWVSC